MIATLLTLNGAPSEALFKKFLETTKGVVAAYQIEEIDNPQAGAVFTVWKDAASRDAYMKSSPVKAEVDKTYANQSRTVYRVRNSK